jgi:HEAT repeat protein
MTKTGNAPGQDAREREAKALGVLKSDAQQKDKMDACKELTRIGSGSSVPVLAPLLADEKYSHMARYALEMIPDPSADAALREALGKVKGKLLAGVIGSIGVRKDAKAVDALAKLLKDPDPVTAEAAARALGKIGNPAAAKAVGDALTGVPEASRLNFCEGLLRCAEALPKGEAQAIYDRLRGLKDAPKQVRTAGMRGAVLARGDAGVPALLDGFANDDVAIVQGAARAAMELPGAAATKAMAAGLGKLPPDRQVLLAQALGRRGDAAAVPALSAAAKAGDKAARVAAVRALGEIRDASAASTLEGLSNDSDGEVAQAAKAALGVLKR